MEQLPFGDQDGVQELLDLGVASLGIGQDFAYEVYRVLHLEGMPLLLPLHDYSGADHLHHRCNVE
jgi:hypothetical protein